MSSINFWSSVTSNASHQKDSLGFLRVCETYFRYGTEKVAINKIENKITYVEIHKQNRNCLAYVILAIKIVSIATIVLPLLMLLGKVIYRSTHTFILIDTEKAQAGGDANKKTNDLNDLVNAKDRQIESLELDLQNAHILQDSEKERTTQIVSELEKCKEELKSLQENLTAESTTHDQQLSRHNHLIEAKDRQIESLELDLQNAHILQDSEKERTTQIVSELEKCKEELKSLQENLTAESTTHDQQISRHNHLIEAKDRQIESLELDLQNAHTLHGNERERMTQIMSELSHCKQELKSLQENLRTESTTHDQQLSSHNHLIETRDKQIQILELELHTLNQNNQERTAQIVSELDQCKQELKSLHENLRTESTTHDQQLSDLKLSLRSERSAHLTFKSEMESTKDKLTKDNATLQANLSSQIALNQSTQLTQLQLTNEIEQFKEILANQEKEKVNYQDQIRLLSQLKEEEADKLVPLKALLDNSDSDIIKTRKRISELEKDLESKNAEIHEMIRTEDKLKETLRLSEQLVINLQKELSVLKEQKASQMTQVALAVHTEISTHKLPSAASAAIDSAPVDHSVFGSSDFYFSSMKAPTITLEQFTEHLKKVIAEDNTNNLLSAFRNIPQEIVTHREFYHLFFSENSPLRSAELLELSKKAILENTHHRLVAIDFRFLSLNMELQKSLRNGTLCIEKIAEEIDLLSPISPLTDLQQTTLLVAYKKLADYHLANNLNDEIYLKRASSILLNTSHAIGDLHHLRGLSDVRWVQSGDVSLRRRQVRIQNKTFETEDGNKNILTLTFSLPSKERETFNKRLQSSYITELFKVQRNTKFAFSTIDKGVYQPKNSVTIGEATQISNASGSIILMVGTEKKYWNTYEKISMQIAPEVTTQELHVFLCRLGMPTLLTSSRFEDLFNERVARCYNSLNPHKADTYNCPQDWIIDAFQDPNNLYEKMALGMSTKNMGGRRTEEVSSDAYKTFLGSGGIGFGATIGFAGVKLGITDIVYSGVYKKQHIANSANSLSLILKGGMMSTLERYENGFFKAGCCPDENIQVGSGNQVFTRALTTNMLSGGHKWSDFAIEGNIFLLISPEAAERLPVAYPCDKAGLRNREYSSDKSYRMAQKESITAGLKGSMIKERLPLSSICDDQIRADKTLPTAEVLFEDIIPSNYIIGAVVASQLDKDAVLTILQSQGITEIQGKPLAACIHVGDSLRSEMFVN